MQSHSPRPAFSPAYALKTRICVAQRQKHSLPQYSESPTERRQLPVLEDVAAMRDMVANIAYEHLGTRWLTKTIECWNANEELSGEEKRLLLSALNRHAEGDYEGCVSLLMGMFEGLLCKYAPAVIELNGKQAELFDEIARFHGLHPSHREDGGPRKLKNSKDLVLLMLILSENGWNVLQRAVGYIVDVTLTNKSNKELAAHNPLRNKICHGEQTDFGNLEHSLKAILVTDLVIRIGTPLLENRKA